MKLYPLAVLTVGILSIVPAARSASREIIELQRDVAAIQDQMRTMQRSLDEKMATLQTLVQQTLESSGKGNTSVAILDSGIKERLAEQQRTLVAPVANLTARMDQMGSEFTGLRDSIADMSDRLNKMQVQMTDLSNTIRTLSAPPAAPPPVGATGVPGAAATPPPGMSAKGLYDSAMRDRAAGNYELARQGFDEFLRFFGNTELAPTAQYYLGDIAYNKADYPGAVRAFDTVLERFPENNRTADATFMKGMALLKSNQRNEAAKEFLAVVQKYPNSEAAAKARAQRKTLGLTTPAAESSAAKPPARRSSRR